MPTILKMLIKKPPIIVILGHIDHGKTTLLDYIRRSNLASTEAGGITQKIGAYEIEFKGEKITFIDTPGHEAFNSLRERGTQIADLAVLVIAADEGLKPQAQESLNYLQATNLPFIIALNKIDKKEAESQKVISQLIEIGVLPEKFGGDIPVVEISALKGTGVEELLELIILLRDLNDLKVETDSQASGFILEVFKDTRRGIMASAIVIEGKVKAGDLLITDKALCKIRIFEDDLGRKINLALPSKPFLVGNFDNLPTVGSKFFVCQANEIEKIRNKLAGETKKSTSQILTPSNLTSENSFNLILKADYIGSLEAIGKIFYKISQENNFNLKVIKADVGPIALEDVYLAKDLKAILINFNLKIDKQVLEAIKNFNLTLIEAKIIYQLEKILLEHLLDFIANQSSAICHFEVLAVFSATKTKKTIGGQVKKGSLKVGQKLLLKRNETTITSVKVLSLEKNKVPVTEVREGDVCGLIVEANEEIKVGDSLVKDML